MLTRHAPDAGRHQRGSVLLLYPAGFLVMLILAAIAIDNGNAYLQQRELADAADAAANDAVTYGADPDALRRGEYRLDPVRVNQAVTRSLLLSGVLDEVSVAIGAPATNSAGNLEISVTLTQDVAYIFAPIVGSSGTRVTATGTADVRFEP